MSPSERKRRRATHAPKEDNRDQESIFCKLFENLRNEVGSMRRRSCGAPDIDVLNGIEQSTQNCDRSEGRILNIREFIITPSSTSFTRSPSTFELRSHKAWEPITRERIAKM
jgi:hypothetical protein